MAVLMGVLWLSMLRLRSLILPQMDMNTCGVWVQGAGLAGG